MESANNLSKLSNTVKDESQLNVISYINEENNSIDKNIYATPTRNNHMFMDTTRANLFDSQRLYTTERNMINNEETSPETRRDLATRRIQSIMRGTLTRRTLEDAGMLLSKRKKVVLSDDGDKIPYVNNFNSEHAPPQNAVEF